MLYSLLIFPLLLIAGFLYLINYQKWEQKRTQGAAYFSLPLKQRRRLKQQIHRHSLLLRPFVELLAKLGTKKDRMHSFQYQGVHGPAGNSSPETFKQASEYQATEEDIFIATQMKCGTTWMQQIVHEIVTYGKGDLSDEGYRHMYALSPWIDAHSSVHIAEAPLVGQPPRRIMNKKHSRQSMSTNSKSD